MDDMLLLYLGTVWTCLVLILGENIEPTSNMEQIFCAFIVRAAVFAPFCMPVFRRSVALIA